MYKTIRPGDYTLKLIKNPFTTLQIKVTIESGKVNDIGEVKMNPRKEIIS